MEERKIVRTEKAGVFFGTIVSRSGDTAVISNARRLWKWSGAASLSELAMYGVANPSDCMFPCPVDEVEVFGVIEIIGVTETAGVSIDKVKEWKKR